MLSIEAFLQKKLILYMEISKASLDLFCPNGVFYPEINT